MSRPLLRALSDGDTMLTLQLLGGFSLAANSTPVQLPTGSARVLAFLGLQQVPQARTRVASQLWPDVDSGRALGNLRSALWRIPGPSSSIVRTDGDCISLQHDVACDAAEIRRPFPESLPPPPIGPIATRKLCSALLPGWYDDWVVAERERLALRQAERLEAFSVRCVEQDRFADAVLYAAASIRIEPLRESAHRALLQAHGALGNDAEVRCHVRFLRGLFSEELGVSLSAETEQLASRWGTPR